MSEKYLTVAEPEQVTSYEPQTMAEGLGLILLDDFRTVAAGTGSEAGQTADPHLRASH